MRRLDEQASAASVIKQGHTHDTSRRTCRRDTGSLTSRSVRISELLVLSKLTAGRPAACCGRVCCAAPRVPRPPAPLARREHMQPHLTLVHDVFGRLRRDVLDLAERRGVGGGPGLHEEAAELGLRLVVVASGRYVTITLKLTLKDISFWRIKRVISLGQCQV